MSQGPEYLTVAQARVRLGISKVKIAQWISDGTLPTATSPYDKRVKLVRREDVDRLAAAPRLPKKEAA